MITDKEKQNREELFRLMQENPDLPVVPSVYYGVVLDGCGRWLGSWGEARIDKYVIGEEYYHFGEDNDIEETLTDGFVDDDAYEAMSGEEAKAKYNSLPWVKAIIVNINTPY